MEASDIMYDMVYRFSVGTQLKRIREARDKTVEDVADVLEMTVFEIEAIEAGNYDDLSTELVQAYVKACDTFGDDIVSDAKLVSQIYVLGRLLEDFLNQDLCKHEMAFALADVVCRSVRMAYKYQDPSENMSEIERNMLIRVCTGIKNSLDTCEYVPASVPGYGAVPIDDVDDIDVLEEWVDDDYCDAEYEDECEAEPYVSVEEDPPVIVPEEFITEQDSVDMETGIDG